jgi:hypothetical protein
MRPSHPSQLIDNCFRAAVKFYIDEKPVLRANDARSDWLCTIVRTKLELSQVPGELILFDFIPILSKIFSSALLSKQSPMKPALHSQLIDNCFRAAFKFTIDGKPVLRANNARSNWLCTIVRTKLDLF